MTELKYMERVRGYEEMGMTTSDAQGVVDAEMLSGKPQRWEVQTYMMLGNPQWENLWTEKDKPLTFATREEAQKELDEHLADPEIAELDWGVKDFRIVPCN